MPILEAFSEVKKVGSYLETEQQANMFVEEAVKLKLSQKLYLDQFEE